MDYKEKVDRYEAMQKEAMEAQGNLHVLDTTAEDLHGKVGGFVKSNQTSTEKK